MKKSINKLPKRTQKELVFLRELILRHLPTCSKIVLFGSYAKLKYVIYDERIEHDGTRTSYSSDFDIMVVMPNHIRKEYRDKVDNCIKLEYYAVSDDIRRPTVSIILESILHVNEKLEVKQYFYSDIIKEGILLHDDGLIPFEKPRLLSPQEIYIISYEYYEGFILYGNQFLESVIDYFYHRPKLPIAAFQLHQACENYCKGLELVFTHYAPKEHNLEKLIERVRKFACEVVDVFPVDTLENKNRFILLCEAYVRGRYDMTFVVTKEDLDYLIPRVELLRAIVEEACQKQLAHLKQLSES